MARDFDDLAHVLTAHGLQIVSKEHITDEMVTDFKLAMACFGVSQPSAFIGPEMDVEFDGRRLRIDDFSLLKALKAMLEAAPTYLENKAND